MNRTQKRHLYFEACKHVAKIDSTIVLHSMLEAAIEGLEECTIWSQFNKEPAGAILVGEGGTGKTTVCNAILSLHPTYTVKTEAVDVQVRTAFFASVPSPSTIKSLAEELLAELGDPHPLGGTASSSTSRLIKLMKISQTKIILLDEFHHLLADSKAGDTRTKIICKWIKNLINKTGVTICLVGTPDCEALVNFDPQLSGRFARRFRLESLKLGTEKKRGELENFLITMARKFVEQLEFNSILDFYDHTNSVRMWASTGGNLRSVMRLLKEAGVIALRANRRDIVMSDLAEAYAKGVTELASICDCNPFAVSYSELLNALSASRPKVFQC